MGMMRDRPSAASFFPLLLSFAAGVLLTLTLVATDSGRSTPPVTTHFIASPPAAPAEKPESGGGYAPPLSKRRVWFDVESLGGFVHAPLATGALSLREAPSDKWIVVTTINPPTDAVKRLATLPGWRTVVVGDSKTPKDWAWPNVTYLSVSDQEALGFSTTFITRTRTYTRKNIGYLYAIQHGARTIYETDDDNELTVDAIPIINTNAAGVATMLEYADNSRIAINHHGHFAQPSTWPRGYPLELIAEPQETRVRRASITPTIQQGLANGDPDLDAVFRLTRKPVHERIDFSFESSPPIAFPPRSFAPFNAQNTVFTHAGFWSLVLPQTVDYRVCDIWRSFWAQRLLWGTGGQLVFVAPYVYQFRNPHAYHGDYVSESQIYDQVAEMLEFLNRWRCSKNERGALRECIEQLAHDMAVAGYWGPADAELVRHFLHDLARVGYVFPDWLEGNDAQFVRACSISHSCTEEGVIEREPIHVRPSIELHGTCGEKIPADSLT